MYDKTRKTEEYYEKLGALLRAVDTCAMPPEDRAALIWAALDYLALLGEVIGTERKK